MAEQGTRTAAPTEFSWGAVVASGIIAGIIFLMMEMILIALAGGEPWGPPRMMAAIVMGRDVLPPPATFDFGIVLMAMAVHFVLSIIYAVILGWAISRWTLTIGPAILVGLGFGLLLYLINFYIFTGLFPWFAMARNLITIVSHIVYGGVLAWAYLAVAERQLWPAGHRS